MFENKDCFQSDLLEFAVTTSNLTNYLDCTSSGDVGESVKYFSSLISQSITIDRLMLEEIYKESKDLTGYKTDRELLEFCIFTNIYDTGSVEFLQDLMAVMYQFARYKLNIGEFRELVYDIGRKIDNID